MSENNQILPIQNIQNLIFTIRNNQVMIDRDLAELYGVKVKRLNEQVKRNLDRFPENFRFQLNDIEKNELVANCDRFKSLKHSSVNPYAFTEQGVAMLSAVLRSETAVKVSIQIIQAFVEMNKFISTNAGIFQRLDKVEQKLIKHNENFDKLFKALEDKSIKPNQGVFFDGQIFDAYKLIADIVRSAKKSIVLIDNYIDDTVLNLFSKKDKKVTCTIFTKAISKQLKLDAEKFNKQYPTLQIKQFSKAHDRFLIIDTTEVYHIGASLKDLGKKWFAFTKMDISSVKVLDKLKEEKLI